MARKQNQQCVAYFIRSIANDGHADEMLFVFARLLEDRRGSARALLQRLRTGPPIA